MRQISGLTQVEFAAHRGLSAKVIKEIERGTGNPTVKTLNQIGTFFGLEVAFVRTHKTPAEEPSSSHANLTELQQLLRELDRIKSAKSKTEKPVINDLQGFVTNRGYSASERNVVIHVREVRCWTWGWTWGRGWWRHLWARGWGGAVVGLRSHRRRSRASSMLSPPMPARPPSICMFSAMMSVAYFSTPSLSVYLRVCRRPST
jgi:transcriptional regulator with XRE-family HTH domain